MAHVSARLAFLLGLGLALDSSSLFAGDAVAVYLTVQGTPAGLERRPDLHWRQAPQPGAQDACVLVDPAHALQPFLGIGGAFTDAAADTFGALPDDSKRQVLEAYFDPDKGIGYSLGRTHINSCDFSASEYTYVKEGDATLSSFDIGHDLKARIPMIRGALRAAGWNFPIYASPWSPPGWMKDNHAMVNGGSLRPEFADAWARYFVRFIKAYAEQGVPIWGVTVQNEPLAVQTWESCIYTGAQEAAFVRDHLGPVLRQSGLAAVKIIGWDHNRTDMVQRATELFADPAAASYIWGMGFHWYVNSSYDNVRAVHEAYPGVHLLLTEACNGPYEASKVDDWDLAEQYGHAMLSDFNNGAEAWTDWNLILDQNGGPNHLGNFCYAPIHCDTRTGSVHRTPAYYYIGHFSKFVRPGAHRIVCAPSADFVQTTAFRNPSGSVAVVIMNETADARTLCVWSAGRAVETRSPAHSMQTLVFEDGP